MLECSGDFLIAVTDDWTVDDLWEDEISLKIRSCSSTETQKSSAIFVVVSVDVEADGRMKFEYLSTSDTSLDSLVYSMLTTYLTHFVKPCLLLTQWNRRFWKKAKEIVIQLRAYLEGTSGSTMVLLSISGLHREGKADPSLLFLLVELSEVTVAASEKLCDFLSRHCSKIRLCSSAELPKVGSLLREFHSINEKLSSSLQYPFLE